jgi:Bacterial Ig domain/GDSL-like Lipase/Acylhydrolase family
MFERTNLGGVRGGTLGFLLAASALGAGLAPPTSAEAASFAFSRNNAASSDANGTSLGVQLTGVSAGDLIAVYVKYEGAATTVTIGDGVDLFTADPVVNASNADLHGQFFYALVSKASGTVTCTATWAASKPYRKIFVYEYSHSGTVAVFDVSNRATATSGTLNSGAVTTTGADEVVFGSYGEYSGNNTSNEQIAGVAADQVRRQAFAAVWSKTFTSPVTGAATATGNSSTWISNLIAFKSTGPADTVHPTIDITAPTPGSTLAGTVAVTANASDNVAVAGVQFKLDGANLGAEDTSAPYSVNWDTTTATNAAHNLTAVARDSSNNTTTATGVPVTVFNTAPFNFVLSNGGNKSVARSASVTNTITATLSAGATAPVAFTASGLPSGASATFSPTSCSLPCSTTMTVTTGAATPLATSTLTVTGTAGTLTRTTTFALTVVSGQDATPPTVSVSAPANGALLAGTTTVSAAASDNVGVAGVQFLLDGANLGAEDTTSPYSVSWNTTTATGGPHVLSARARDAAGNNTFSANVSVNVDNQAPTGSIVIDGGATATNSTAATLTLSASDTQNAVTQMRFSNTGSSFSTAEAFAVTKAWTLATGAGTKTVYVQFKDAAGNWSVSFMGTIVLDTTAPTISGVSSSNITNNSANINWTTSEGATSQVEYGLTTSYGTLTAVNATLVTAHTLPLSGLAPSTSYKYRVRSKDAAGNETVGSNNSFTTLAGADTVPPVLSNGGPTGTKLFGTTQATLTVITNESATCRFEVTPGVAYASMANVFATTGGTTHSSPISGLLNGFSYRYYLRCADAFGNANGSDYLVSFSVAGSVTIGITPSTSVLFVGGRQTFACSVGAVDNSCAWSLQEGDAGGSLSPSGAAAVVYTAPGQTGTYHVIATSNADSTRSAVATITVADGSTGAAPMPLISRFPEVHAFASNDPTGTLGDFGANRARDDVYYGWGSYWRDINLGYPAWVAYDLSGVPVEQRAQVLVAWYNDGTYGYGGVVGRVDGTYNEPGAYVIEGNRATGSSTGAPSSGWTTLVSVPGNTVHSRSHLLDLTGYNWIRFYTSAGNPSNQTQNTDVEIKLEVFDAHQGNTDSWAFLGDSITAGAMTHNKSTTPNFAQAINAVVPGNFPMDENAGNGFDGALQGMTRLNVLLANSQARYIAIAYGMNDAGSAMATDYSFYNAYKAMVDVVLAAGRIPVIPTISWTALQPWQDNVGDPVTGSPLTLNRQLAKLKDDYRAQGKVIIDGPDLWTFFKNNPTLITSGNFHPTDAGYVEFQTQWALAAIANVYQK